MPKRAYKYVGPDELKQRSRPASCQRAISAEDIVRWMRGHRTIRATFIIDLAEQLWIADRHSEHVACANGEDVLAAGEMVFDYAGKRLEVSEVTNQSTGYCPEPECWEVVSRVLDRLQIARPPELTTPFIFRRCDACGGINIVKDNHFQCAICDAQLSANWNFW